ncbi:hypothetical protein SAMN05660461_6351 [Chitinophaga ginsengisegetis]|uniref:Uncharacterized protein n=1 Tax=Chitinophaga ginsengisegetis TaxID=393003 RepID=A0A1T5PCP2_9BACT|nr:hypothetical protein [Chitinophaga ginsengisegetis]MDR6570190.1 hypothetical protein [Chitinophaga ginsengisegetis]MDR6649924.1 hypothetical protein [Chitinophaga ginsengisegetis]MDR6656435.1 hypothetical protein [Chitinophaga ginsengisegetis]SKD10436.1 hypothetical protein SAMN05660461_6351 [Chitinophaga ginsengisegetis]
MESFELTPEEAAVVESTHFILLKNSAIEKIMVLMGKLQEALAAYDRNSNFPFKPEWLLQGGKISKGEQYKGLPWVMLDYPRYFSKTEVFAFRTMFWWGHYFSATLHLAGNVKRYYSAVLESSYTKLAEAGFQVYVQEDPWEHDFENGNYCFINTLSLDEWKTLISRNDFIKVAKPFVIGHWGKIITDVVEAYAALLNILENKGA